MLDLLSLHKQILSAHIKDGDTAVDFTMGNGHDTLFLAQAVGENGRVYAFDIQEQALIHTKERLEQNGVSGRVQLLPVSHHLAAQYVKEQFSAGVFNLGYLPGGDKALTTRCETTRLAVLSALDLLKSGGILLIAVYPGHAEGEREGRMLCEILEKLDRKKYCAAVLKIINSADSPYFITVEKTPEKLKA